jgi:hypothetical protein
MILRRTLALALGSLFLASGPAWTDDTSPFKDWKEVKQKDSAHAKERAEFWSNKGVEPKQQVWVGFMWLRARDFDKAIEWLEKFLKTAAEDDTNRTPAAFRLIEAARDKGDWPLVVAKAQAFRSMFPAAEAGLIGESFAEEGRAQRMAGDEGKAIEAFRAAAEKAYMGGIVDLMDLHWCNGNIDEAKNVGAIYMAAENVKPQAKEQNLKPMLDFLELVGKKAPALEGVQQVGQGEEVTAFGGKPTVLYYWNIPMGGQEFGFRSLRALARKYEGQIQVAAISTYDKYDPITKKVNPDLSDEDAIKGYKIYMEQVHGSNTPPAIVVPVSVKDALVQTQNTQKTVIDAEGNFRYARLFADAGPVATYNWRCLEFALKKLLGS